MGRRQRRADRQARYLQLYEALPPMQRGMAVSVLLAYALAALATDGVLAVAVFRGASRAWQGRSLGPVAATRAGASPALAGLLAAHAAQWAVARRLLRSFDTGRAQVWLEQHERWLAGDAGEHDRHR